MTTRPAHAEKFDINPLFETVKMPSKFLPGLEQIVSLVACPNKKCGAKRAFTCQPFECECGLWLQHDIGVVHVWEKEPAL